MSSTRLLMLGVGVLGLAFGESPATADEPTQQQSTANQDAAESALSHENSKRASGAISALAAATVDPAKKWEAGQVHFGGQWVAPDELARFLKQDKLDAAYRERRNKTPDTADGHFKLALWCRENGLSELQRGHLVVATQLDPKDTRPRKALGMVQYQGVWMTEADAAAARDLQTAAFQNYQKWKREFNELRVRLASGDAATREGALNDLRKIRDPFAVPLMEEASAQIQDERISLAIVHAAGQILHQAATRSLVRHAVWHGNPAVRSAAVDQLSHRDLDHYVSDLIRLMRPGESGEAWTTVQGRPAHVWFMQDYDRKDVVIDIGGGPFQDLNIPNKQRFEAIAAKNQFRLQNAQSALHALTGEDFGIDQQAWINWWRNVSYVSPGDYSYPTSVDVVTYISHSCFVAGTPVWTLRGLVPIDHIQLGDLVLSKNMETGELGFQPVIDRTIRRQKGILDLQFEGETIGITAGHPIATPDREWVRADELSAGDLVHAVGGSATVVACSEGKSDQVYNLVVSGSNTYFVGRNRMLVHDITPIADVRKPAAVPTETAK
jgi:hypothetical protein